MASPLYLTLLAGPVEAVPVPKPLVDALTSVQVQESATGGSGFQLHLPWRTTRFCRRSFCWRADRRSPFFA